MTVGITGHQKREGIDWVWVRQTITAQLNVHRPQQAMSSLAEGTDQIFADVVLDKGIPLLAVVPLDNYARFFTPSGLAIYQRLLRASSQVALKWPGDPEHAFLNAGRYIVDRCDLLFAVWDGRVADGLGGTADVVLYATQRSRRVLHINPCDETVRII